MRLGTKAWNNVVIISMLLMIFFLNGIHHKLNPQSEPKGPQRLLPEQSFVLTLAFPGYKIERIGTSWRIDGLWQAQPEQLRALIALWQTTLLDVAQVSLNQDQALSVAQIWIASQELPLSYQLYQADGQYYLFDKQQQHWLQLSTEQANLLFAPLALDKQ
ncbi:MULTISPECIES: hypothetical protein [Pseudoalteromonas]|uniref:DUF4340 domain-containing protein n=1 Tax=Pseudoalteromonas amylolytica TaxID=1859457 RepID=A0A1S1MMK6_9GAMM|nr:MULTISPECIES: hypothetical protein [Pseudoalteromonas]OHU86262.1 hypothetical protein BFC16_16290 [Pseudoalteromonas sp. JW3]OHU89633.1 hypothetical protein BET10_16030 [Pseudoalteromonas amylolytica]